MAPAPQKPLDGVRGLAPSIAPPLRDQQKQPGAPAPDTDNVTSGHDEDEPRGFVYDEPVFARRMPPAHLSCSGCHMEDCIGCACMCEESTAWIDHPTEKFASRRDVRLILLVPTAAAASRPMLLPPCNSRTTPDHIRHSMPLPDLHPNLQSSDLRLPSSGSGLGIPCSRTVPAPQTALISAVAAALPIVVAAASPPAYATMLRVIPTAAGSPFATSTSRRDAGSSSATSSLSSTSSWMMSANSLFSNSPNSPTQVKKDSRTLTLTLGPLPRVTMSTRVQLSPTGHALGRALVVARNDEFARNDEVARNDDAAHMITPRPARAPIPSVLLTPQPAAANAAHAAAPAPNLAPAPIPTKYRIQGVPIFYPTHEMVEEAARLLSLANPCIMVSVPSQPEKLEAYILGKPFAGEDVPAGPAHDIAYVKKKRGTKESKTEGLTVFWAQFFETYWKKFPWKLSLEEEPDPNAPEVPPPQTADEAFAALGLNLSKEEADAKSKIQIETKQKIKRWFGRECPGSMGIQGNPYFAHLAQLSRGNSSSAPRCPADYQFYMRHRDYKDTVNECFEEECGGEGTGTAKQITRCCAVAKRMYEAEPPEVKKALKAECNEEHAEQIEAYNDEDESMPSPDPEVQEQCRNNFLAIVQPLLAGLHAYTSLTINIIAGRINEETKVFEMLSANAGTTLKAYLRFVHAGYLEVHNLVDTGGSLSSLSVGQHVTRSTMSAGPPVPPLPSLPAEDAFVGMNMLRMDDNEPPNDVMMGEPGPLIDDGVDDMLASGVLLPGALAMPAASALATPTAPALATPAAPALATPAAPLAPTAPVVVPAARVAPVVVPAARAAPLAPAAPVIVPADPATPAPVVPPAAGPP
ncbi:hypothetical protein K438DRAFT_1980334 [Mycena galopus ATCC 62051]|nr:hypothetical protein K438DRAFT_1980334 [Mycena galopus ATCC 62051]